MSIDDEAPRRNAVADELEAECFGHHVPEYGSPAWWRRRLDRSDLDAAEREQRWSEGG